jgi:hypothetical protein
MGMVRYISDHGEVHRWVRWVSPSCRNSDLCLYLVSSACRASDYTLLEAGFETGTVRNYSARAYQVISLSRLASGVLQHRQTISAGYIYIIKISTYCTADNMCHNTDGNNTFINKICTQ